METHVVTTRGRWGASLRHWAVAFGVHQVMRSLVYFPRYIRHWIKYSKGAGRGQLRWSDSQPCLTDWTKYTPFDAHYFYQGAWLARQLAKQPPALHVDVASSVLAISTISASVDIAFLDYRPIRTQLKGLFPVAGSIVRPPFAPGSLLSLSCLHVIEHIGLGRYGDPIDPKGSDKAASELEQLLGSGGILYLSVPVGRARVCFNAHRVLSPMQVGKMFSQLRIVEFSYVDDAGVFHERASPDQATECEYGCGMYVLQKE
jgi:hypothetical protein